MNMITSLSTNAYRTERLLPTEYLKCPKCGNDLSAKADSLVCTVGHSFLYRDNVVDFSSAQEIGPVQRRSEQSFGVEWTQYYSYLGWTPKELAREKEDFLTATRAMPNFFSNKVVVDAGCGNGRYINIVNTIAYPRPRLIIGVDLSDSIFIAARNCSSFDNVLFIRLDLNLLPAVLKHPIDFVYSIGVLHHTPDARASFNNLAKCVKGKGYLSVFVYGKGNVVLYKVNTFLRNRFFQKWPRKLVYLLCVLIAIPGQVFRVKFFGPWMCDFITRFIFVSHNVHNMFDAYTAGWTSFHEKEEVEQWYRDNGMDAVVESQVNHTVINCIGRRVNGDLLSKVKGDD